MRTHERRAHRPALAIPLTLLTTALLLGCQEWGTAPIGTDRVGPEFSHKPGHGGGGGEDGGAKKGDILTVRVEDGLVTPVSPPQEVEVTFSNKTFFEVSTNGVHSFSTTTNLVGTQVLAQDLTSGPCFAFASPSGDPDPAIVETLRDRLVDDQQRLRGFTMVLDKRGLDASGTQSPHHRLSTSWREDVFGLEDALIMLRVGSSPDFGDATVVLDNGSFDNIADGGVDLTITGGTARAFTPSTDPQVALLCPNVDEFKVSVTVPAP